MEPMGGLAQMCAASGSGGFAINLIALAAAVAVAGFASALVSRALWDLVLRRSVNRRGFEAWRKAALDAEAKSDPSPGGPRLTPPPVLATEAAFSLPTRAFCAQVVARLQAVAEASPLEMEAFLTAAAQLPANAPPSSDRRDAKAWTAQLIERAVDDLQTRLIRMGALAGYAVNLAVALILAVAARPPEPEPEAAITSLIVGLMAGLIGVLVQNWLARTLDR